MKRSLPDTKIALVALDTLPRTLESHCSLRMKNWHLGFLRNLFKGMLYYLTPEPMLGTLFSDNTYSLTI